MDEPAHGGPIRADVQVFSLCGKTEFFYSPSDPEGKSEIVFVNPRDLRYNECNLFCRSPGWKSAERRQEAAEADRAAESVNSLPIRVQERSRRGFRLIFTWIGRRECSR